MDGRKGFCLALLQKKICNVVVFDYSPFVPFNGNPINYMFAAYNSFFVGQAIGEFIKQYIPKKQPVGLVKMVSHSLGSQIMAKVARMYGIGKLERLTGLDPAGPGYTFPFIKHLEAADGKFVDIIHTDGGFFGDPRAVGTVDFFPNHGTRYQPGCDSTFNLGDLTSPCSHQRSYQTYAESILNPEAFLAKKCRQTFVFNVCCCNESDTAYMGYYVNTSAHGTYFLTTNAQKPFGRGPEGIDF